MAKYWKTIQPLGKADLHWEIKKIFDATSKFKFNNSIFRKYLVDSGFLYT